MINCNCGAHKVKDSTHADWCETKKWCWCPLCHRDLHLEGTEPPDSVKVPSHDGVWKCDLHNLEGNGQFFWVTKGKRLALT